MALVTGDPASLAATASALASLAARLGQSATELTSRPGPGAPRLPWATRRVVVEVGESARITAQLSRRFAALLQQAAYEQANAAHRLAALGEAAQAAGLALGEDGITRPLGVSGVADAGPIVARERALADLRAQYQAETDGIRARAEELCTELTWLARQFTGVADGLR